jgi:hypothetical protein
MKLFMTICILHFAEHVTQLIELYVLHWSRPDCLGILGMFYPWLMRSESLHLAYALYMLWGLYHFRLKVNNHWWFTAINLQKYHLVEHWILMIQLLAGYKPTGIGGLWFPRIELHFAYNLMVLVPMLLAIKLKLKPSLSDRTKFWDA